MILSSSSLSQNSENKPSSQVLELRSKIKATETELAPLVQEAAFRGVIGKVNNRRVRNVDDLSKTEQEAGELKTTLKKLYENLFDADKNEVKKAAEALAQKQVD